jgi:DNA repair protein RecN (Recombination protein N)
MLAKAILAQYSKLPTLIFDEIDTGVSGEIAIKMGEIMKEMSQTI